MEIVKIVKWLEDRGHDVRLGGPGLVIDGIEISQSHLEIWWDLSHRFTLLEKVSAEEGEAPAAKPRKAKK